MTKEIIHSLNNKQLVDQIKGFGKTSHYLFRFLKYHQPEILDELFKRTNFLEHDISVMARVFCLEHNIISRPTCKKPGCNNPTHWKRQKFNPYCSGECCYSDEHRIERIIQTMEKRYGVKNYTQTT